MSDRDFHAKVARMRAGRAFRSGFSIRRAQVVGAGFDRANGVLIRGSFRKHRGSGSKPGSGGRMRAHITYISGEKHKEAERDRRHLYDAKGREQTALEARERHGGCFIEHRIIVSPSTKRSKVTEDDLILLGQAVVQEAQARNPKADIESSIAVHLDTDTPHAHILLTSDQRVRLTRDDYRDLREITQDLRMELDQMRERGLEHSHKLEFNIDNDLTNDRELGRDHDLDMGVSL